MFRVENIFKDWSEMSINIFSIFNASRNVIAISIVIDTLFVWILLFFIFRSCNKIFNVKLLVIIVVNIFRYNIRINNNKINKQFTRKFKLKEKKYIRDD